MMGSSFEGVGISTEMPRQEPSPEELTQRSLSNIGRKFMVMSGKGGVGKTSVSVNLSIALANRGYKVGILDVDLHGPDIPRMLGLKGMLDLNENGELVPKKYSENLCAVSIESLMPNNDDAVIWRGPLKHSAIQQFLGKVAWGKMDYLIIDSPPGTGDEPLSIAQLIKEAQAIIVTTPQEVALADVRKSINFCKTVKMNVFGLVENMSGFQCPHCEKMIDLLGAGGGQKTAKKFDIRFLGKIPFDTKMVTCGDEGISYQDKYRFTVVTKAFEKITDEIVQSAPNLIYCEGINDYIVVGSDR